MHMRTCTHMHHTRSDTGPCECTTSRRRGQRRGDACICARSCEHMHMWMHVCIHVRNRMHPCAQSYANRRAALTGYSRCCSPVYFYFVLLLCTLYFVQVSGSDGVQPVLLLGECVDRITTRAPCPLVHMYMHAYVQGGGGASTGSPPAPLLYILTCIMCSGGVRPQPLVLSERGP